MGNVGLPCPLSKIAFDAATRAAGGDSGSLIVTQIGNNPVALLFAGSDSVTFGNPIGQVLDLLAMELGLPTGTLHIDGAP